MNDIIVYLQEKNRPVTVNELSEHFGIRKHNITRRVKKMNEFGLVHIVIDGKKFMITIKEEKNETN